VSNINILPQGSGLYTIQGDLTFSTIDKKIVNSFAFLKPDSTVTIDLSQVVTTDSAGLALIIEWIKYARNNRVKIKFNNIPQQLLKLATLCGLEYERYFGGSPAELTPLDPPLLSE